jgi:hypothetical protein
MVREHVLSLELFESSRIHDRADRNPVGEAHLNARTAQRPSQLFKNSLRILQDLGQVARSEVPVVLYTGHYSGKVWRHLSSRNLPSMQVR